MKKNQHGFGAVAVLAVIIIVGLIGAVSYLVYDRQKSATKDNQAAIQNDSQKATNATQQEESERPYDGQLVTSGLGRFTIELPQGWNEVLRPMDSDWLLLTEGTKQPIYSPGTQITVTDLPSFGSDGPRVFTVLVHDNIAPPEGIPSDFTLSNGGQSIEGTKYATTYSDTLEGLGGHKKGEKKYEYRFKLKGGKNLAIWYSVYAEDLNDQNTLIDEVVDSITIKD